MLWHCLLFRAGSRFSKCIRSRADSNWTLSIFVFGSLGRLCRLARPHYCWLNVTRSIDQNGETSILLWDWFYSIILEIFDLNICDRKSGVWVSKCSQTSSIQNRQKDCNKELQRFEDAGWRKDCRKEWLRLYFKGAVGISDAVNANYR